MVELFYHAENHEGNNLVLTAYHIAERVGSDTKPAGFGTEIKFREWRERRMSRRQTNGENDGNLGLAIGMSRHQTNTEAYKHGNSATIAYIKIHSGYQQSFKVNDKSVCGMTQWTHPPTSNFEDQKFDHQKYRRSIPVQPGKLPYNKRHWGRRRY